MKEKDEVLLELPRGKDVLLIRRGEWKGKLYTDLRYHFRAPGAGSTALHPTERGVRVRDDELGALLAALQKIAGEREQQ